MYSTPADTLLGAVMESATGRPIDDIIVREMTDRYDLPTLRPEQRNRSNAEGVAVYQWDAQEQRCDAR
jgi:CubicO group peptidase (beta-lactamase class C family)